ncbi:putative membrane protein [Kroppenstedtia sanguinis]|uniref:Uncharacterized protein n=1 Tax=Kroppenstedtia sanguinis TaxID=1380684 RepID=A0ABW4C5Q3_9BACL
MFGDFFTELVAAFATLVVFGFVIWMVLIVIMFFKELFTPGDIQVRDYLYRVWKRFLFSFEVTAYGGIVVVPYLMNKAEEDDVTRYMMMLILAILFSALFLYIRFKIGFRRRRRG